MQKSQPKIYPPTRRRRRVREREREGGEEGYEYELPI